MAGRDGGQSSARPQDPGGQEEGERRRDELQVIEVRGNCPWPGTPPHPAQDRSQLPEGGNEIARPREVVARLRGGETRDSQPVARLSGGETASASVGGGGVGEQEDGMEIRVVWGGTVEKPIPIVSHPTPRMSSSPPFSDRSWVAKPVGRKVQVGASTLQRIIPVSRTPNKCEILRNRLRRPTTRRPTTLQIPVKTLGETGEPEENILPMDLSHKAPTVQETSREDLRTTSRPPLVFPRRRVDRSFAFQSASIGFHRRRVDMSFTFELSDQGRRAFNTRHCSDPASSGHHRESQVG